MRAGVSVRCQPARCAELSAPRQTRAPARRSPRPECPRRGRSARCRPRPAAASGSRPSDFRLWRSILRRWPKAASVTRSQRAAFAGRAALARGTSSTSDDVTLGGGTKALTARCRTGCAPRCASRPAPTAGRRSWSRAAATMRSATSRWNISTSRSIPRRPRLGGQPADQQRGRDVVGQVGDDARRRAVELRSRIEVERVAGDDLEPAGIVRGDLRERGDGALVALDRDHPPRAVGEQRAGEPAGPGTDLDHGRRRRAGRRRARCGR